jgi:inner membrane protein
VRWGLLFLYACAGAVSHILLDFTNNYGVRPFLPFHDRWYSWDIVFIIEPVLHLVLLAGLLLPALFRLVQEEIGASRQPSYGRTGAILALTAVMALWGLRDHQHRRALAAVEGRLYSGERPIRASAYPYYVNPFKWYAVVETKTAFRRMLVDSLSLGVSPTPSAQVWHKMEDNAVSRAARASRLGQVYLNWAQYPVVEVQPLQNPGSGYVVHFVDLRFLYPERSTAPLGAYGLLGPDLKLLDVWFGRGPARFQPAP